MNNPEASQNTKLRDASYYILLDLTLTSNLAKDQMRRERDRKKPANTRPIYDIVLSVILLIYSLYAGGVNDGVSIHSKLITIVS